MAVVEVLVEVGFRLEVHAHIVTQMQWAKELEKKCVVGEGA